MSAKKNSITDFYRKERERMISFVRCRIEDASDRDSEDVVQDVMLGLWNAADISLSFEKLSSYVYRSLRNRVIDLLRSRKHTVSLNAHVDDGNAESLEHILSDTRYDAANEYEKEEIRTMLFSALDALKEDERTIVVMTEFENRSFAECSSLLGEPEGTLLSRKSRTMRKIRALLGELSTITED